MKIIKDFIAKTNRMPLLAAFLLYQVLILIRIGVEMQETMPAVFIMQLCWFDCVMMFFIINFKYLLKLQNKELSAFALGGFLTYIPLFYSFFLNHKWHLNFINPVSFRQVVFDMITLLAVHEYNWPMFPELVLLLLSSFCLGFVLSGKPLKSLLAAVVSTYSSFLCLGFSWVAVNPNHPSFSHFTSGFADHIIYSLYYISFFSLLCVIAFWKELIDFIGQIKRSALSAASVFIFAALAEVALFLFFKEKFYGIDYVLLFPVLAAAAFAILCIFQKAWKFIFPPVWIVVLSAILLIAK